MAERGVTVSHETIRDWPGRFGRQFAAQIRRHRPVLADKWHLDEVVIRMSIRTGRAAPGAGACSRVAPPSLPCARTNSVGGGRGPAEFFHQPFGAGDLLARHRKLVL